MLIDTHGHINMMVKKIFDTPLQPQEILHAQEIIHDAAYNDVTTIINVGTSRIESDNCVILAQKYKSIFATVGIHPNDCTPTWRDDFKYIQKLVINKEKNKIVGIGECGLDRHYPDHDLYRQYDAFRAHIELALNNSLTLVIHSRDAYDETLKIIDEYKHDIKRAVMHCFSYDQTFADHVIAYGYMIGIGGTLTYPKNDALRIIATTVDLNTIVLETDAPFLPPQIIRGKQNHPKYIKTIAEFLAELRTTSYEIIARQTTYNAKLLFNLQ